MQYYSRGESAKIEQVALFPFIVFLIYHLSIFTSLGASEIFYEKTILGSVLLAVGFWIGGNAYGENNCVKVDLKLKNQTHQAFEIIKSLKKCAKPAVKYHLKACV